MMTEKEFELQRRIGSRPWIVIKLEPWMLDPDAYVYLYEENKSTIFGDTTLEYFTRPGYPGKLFAVSHWREKGKPPTAMVQMGGPN